MNQSEKVLTARVAVLRGVLEGRLDAAEGPIAAIELAGLLGICSGNREGLRRMVRSVIAHGREHEGLRICADSHGCWLARDAGEWAHYRAAVATKAKFEFVRMAKAQQAVTEANNGQRKLFDRPVAGSQEAAWAKA